MIVMACSTIELLNILGKKWDATILEEIKQGNDINFDKLLSLNAKIYPKTLNKALKDLVGIGLITKEIYYQNRMKRSRYLVTLKGKELLISFEYFKQANCLNNGNPVKNCGECELGHNQVSDTNQKVSEPI